MEQMKTFWNRLTAGRSVRMGLTVTYALVAALLLFAGTTAALYFASDSGEDAARVARFVVDVVGTSPSYTVGNNTSKTEYTSDEYTFSVTNSKDGIVSEVAFAYDVIFDFTAFATLKENNGGTIQEVAGVPAGVTITLDNVASTSANIDGRRIVFENVGTFAPVTPVTKTHSYKINIDTSKFSVQMGETAKDIKISVVARQID